MDAQHSEPIEKGVRPNLVNRHALRCGTSNTAGHGAHYGMIRNYRAAAMIGLLILDVMLHHAADHEARQPGCLRGSNQTRHADHQQTNDYFLFSLTQRHSPLCVVPTVKTDHPGAMRNRHPITARAARHQKRLQAGIRPAKPV